MRDLNLELLMHGLQFDVLQRRSTLAGPPAKEAEVRFLMADPLVKLISKFNPKYKYIYPFTYPCSMNKRWTLS